MLLAQDLVTNPADGYAEPTVDDPARVVDEAPAIDEMTAHWRGSTEYATSPGLPGRGVVVASTLATAGVAGLDFALTGGLSIFFDLCFVVIGLVGAMAVCRHDLFTTGVLIPLVFAATIATIALAAPETLTTAGGFSKAFLTGLAAHAGPLVAAYAVALAVVFGRAAATRRR